MSGKVVIAGNVVVDRATSADVEGILALERANRVDQGGVFNSCFEPGELTAAFADLPSIVARQDGRVVGFLLAFEKTAAATPMVQAMLKAYAGGPDAYVYGPVCVEASMRGHGLAGAMFALLLHLLPGREGILFINARNEPSRRAHEKMPGMREVGRFELNGLEYLVLSYRGPSAGA